MNTQAIDFQGRPYRVLELNNTYYILESADGTTRLTIARWVFNATGWSLI